MSARGEGATENEMLGRNHGLNGHEFAQTLGDSEGQRSLACSGPWGHKELDTTEKLNNKEKALLEQKVNLYWALFHERHTASADSAISPKGDGFPVISFIYHLFLNTI